MPEQISADHYLGIGDFILMTGLFVCSFARLTCVLRCSQENFTYRRATDSMLGRDREVPRGNPRPSPRCWKTGFD